MNVDQIIGLAIVAFVAGWWFSEILRDGTWGFSKARGRRDSLHGATPEQLGPPSSFPLHRSPSSGMAAESSRTSMRKPW